MGNRAVAFACFALLLQSCDSSPQVYYFPGGPEPDVPLYMNVVIRDSGKLYSAHNVVRYTIRTEKRRALEPSEDCLFCVKSFTDWKVLSARNILLKVGKGDSIVVLLPENMNAWVESASDRLYNVPDGVPVTTDWLLEEVGPNPNPQLDYDRDHDGYKDRRQSGHLPRFVAIKKLDDPGTMRLVDPYKLGHAFHRKIKLVSVTVSKSPVGQESTLDAPWIASFPKVARGDHFPLDITRGSFVQGEQTANAGISRPSQGK